MKTCYILEVGTVDGKQITNMKISKRIEAISLFESLVWFFSEHKYDGTFLGKFPLTSDCPRRSWQNGKNFVCITRQDGSYTEGSFASSLRKED